MATAKTRTKAPADLPRGPHEPTPENTKVVTPGGIKEVAAISIQDAQLILQLLARIDLKGSEVAAFNRAQALIAHACGQQELPPGLLYPQQQ